LGRISIKVDLWEEKKHKFVIQAKRKKNYKVRHLFEFKNIGDDDVKKLTRKFFRLIGSDLTKNEGNLLTIEIKSEKYEWDWEGKHDNGENDAFDLVADIKMTKKLKKKQYSRFLENGRPSRVSPVKEDIEEGEAKLLYFRVFCKVNSHKIENPSNMKNRRATFSIGTGLTGQMVEEGKIKSKEDQLNSDVFSKRKNDKKKDSIDFVQRRTKKVEEKLKNEKKAKLYQNRVSLGQEMSSKMVGQKNSMSIKRFLSRSSKAGSKNSIKNSSKNSIKISSRNSSELEKIQITPFTLNPKKPEKPSKSTKKD